MKTFFSLCLLSTLLLAVGCGRSIPPGVAQIAVMLDGTVYLNGTEIDAEKIPEKFDELGEIEEIWYHREDPSAGQHENVMKVVREIDSHGVNIELYLDAEFTNHLPTD